MANGTKNSICVDIGVRRANFTVEDYSCGWHQRKGTHVASSCYLFIYFLREPK